MNKKIAIYFTILWNISFYAQSNQINGIITDTLNTPLPFTNILAKPQSQDVDMAFAISDEKGKYKLALDKSQDYIITVSFLGFKSQSFKVNITENITKNIKLKLADNELDEVIIIRDNPVIVKEDTITYRTDVFTTGEERKLRQILKKLPGVEVDKQGGVLVNGKKVNKLLVDGKIFFGGGTKLGVENIPADAVSEVEVIDNYNEVAFLKGLSGSEKMAMNIKLKKGKKRFIFGDVEAGGGTDKHYILHPNLFYYSPKTNINFIGDINNNGVKSFTVDDYMNFEGGIGKMFSDPSSYYKLQNDDLSAFLSNQDFKASKNNFAAGQIGQVFHEKLDFSAYTIFSNTETETELQSTNTYISEDTETREIKSDNGNFENQFLISKISLNFTPNIKEDISYSGYIKTNNNKKINEIETVSSFLTDQFYTLMNSDALTVKQNAEWHKKISSKHTFSATANYYFNKIDPRTNWLTNKPFLPELLPLIEEGTYNIKQIKDLKTQNFDLLFKYYWVLNNKNHIYTTIGNNHLDEELKTDDYQELETGDKNNFYYANFGNDLNVKLNDIYVGVQHKFRVGIVTFKYGASLHHYNWQVNQSIDIEQNKTVLLPDFLSTIKISSSEKINFRYNLKSNFSNASNYANKLQILSYNSAKLGNENLENQLYHWARLWYAKFSMYRSLMMNVSINYKKKVKGIKNEVILNGINQLRYPILLDNPETNWNFSGGIRKGINKVTLKFNGSSQFSKYTQVLNENTYENSSISHRMRFEISTNFKKYPNFDIGFSKRFSELKSPNSITKFTFEEPFINLEYNFLNNFYLKADYNKTTFRDQFGHKNKYEMTNAELEYHQEDSMWSFKISSTNILGIDYKNDTNISDYIVSENRTYIMPRIWLFTITYKL